MNADRFSSLGAFQFVQTADGKIDPETAWKLLDQRLDDGSIPAIVDQSTAMWALGKSIGDTLTYTDENGNSFQVTLAGLLSNSIFQGSVLISEEHFMDAFSLIRRLSNFTFGYPPSGPDRLPGHSFSGASGFRTRVDACR